MTREAAIEHSVEPTAGRRAETRAGRSRQVKRRLAGRCATPGESGTVDESSVEHLHSELLAVERRLAAADGACAADTARCVDLERRYDQARSKLEHDHRRIRRLLGDLAGPCRLASIGPASRGVPVAGGRRGMGPKVEPQARRAQPIVGEVDRTIELLSQFEIVPLPFPEVAYDFPAMAAELDGDVRELEAAACGLDAARAAAVASRIHLEAVIAETDRVLLWSGRLLESLGHLAKEPSAP